MSSDLTTTALPTDFDEVVRTFPAILDRLRQSYDELERRSNAMETDLFTANEELGRKVAELDTVKRHLEAVLTALPTGVVVRDAEGLIVSANPAAERILGAPLTTLLGETLHVASDIDQDSEPRGLTASDGRQCVIARHESDIHLTDGSYQGSVEILHDRTEEVALNERLHTADKMVALGTLAAGVAHEIRNPLNAVKGFASLLRRSDNTEPRERRWASLIVEGVTESDAIIENMLSFGSPERLRRETVDGEELIKSAVKLALTEGGSPTITIRSEAPPFIADRIKLRQTIRNLIVNAVRAADGEAQIEVRLTRIEDQIVLTVGDSGPGIPEELRHRVLDPFFTTHNDGTGLGLALVATIARLHGGRVEISSEPSPLGGAELRVLIPYQPTGDSVDSIPTP